MIPNKTDSQILYQQFKYFDLDSTGFCTLQNFIRVQNRIGVVLPKIKDLERIFEYFSDPETSLLNYKNFCNIIFNLLINKLLEANGAMTLLELLKNLQIIDFEGNKRLNSDEFITALKRTGIKLENSEIQTLFLGQDYFLNGVVKYQVLLDILINKFWDEKKNSLSEELFFILTNDGRKLISLNDMKNIFDKIVENSPDKKFLMNFIDKYKIINKNRISQNLILSDLIRFLKFYGFGQDSYSYLENLINVLNPERDNALIPIKLERKNENNYKKINEYKKPKDIRKGSSRLINDIFESFREKLFNYNRKSFFNFIKHFKYYDNNSDFMSKYNFSKVLKDFNINLEQNDLEKIFDTYGTINNEKTMNYKNFINDLISEFTNEEREKIIRYIYSTIEERGNKFNRDIDLSFLKEVYNAKKNYFKKEESDNRLEFEDCLELYNYIYKGNKNELFSLEYFLEFYKCISFLIQSDEDFNKLISNEWRVPLEYLETELQEEKYNYTNENNTNKNDEIDYEYEKKPKLTEKLKNNNYFSTQKNQNQSLLLLNDSLKSRGLRGILYLHLEFINSCQNLSKITFNDFLNVFEIQHINLPSQDIKNIFNTFISKNNKNYLDFSAFIRNYKQELNENKLSCVEQAFSNLDTNENDKVPLNIIKKLFKADKHPDVLNGLKKEEEIILEFLDCFNINYEILSLDSKINNDINSQRIIDFEIFANFYEYVSFIYPNDKEFENIVNSSWN